VTLSLVRVRYREIGEVQEGTEGFGVQLEELRETIRGMTLDIKQMEQTARIWERNSE